MIRAIALLPSALLLSLLVCAGLSFSQAVQQPIITAHIIAHSHCDPGWLDTFEVTLHLVRLYISLVPLNEASFQTYYRKDVATILSRVFEALLADEKKRFIWSETYDAFTINTTILTYFCCQV